MSSVRLVNRHVLLWLLLAAIAPAGLLGLACGVSQSAIYEGDVRFEHCMALDSRSEVKPTIQRACWTEWSRFYILGQTRDRVEYARNRISQLQGEGDFEDWSPSEPKRLAVPEPTSALEPPPMMFESDGGSAPPSPPPDPGADGGTPPGGECSAECEEAWRYCQADCEGANCETACAGKLKRCMRRCY